MAMSLSLQEVQAPISCQLCEESNEIQWKCLQCNFLMCSRCRTIHQKVRSSNQHKIIDINYIAEYQQQSSILDFHIECGFHAGQICCSFCQTCEVVVCPSCIAKTHHEHSMIVMNEAYDLAMKSMKCINLEVKQKLSEIVSEKYKLEAIKSSVGLKYAKEKRVVLNRDSLVKDEVNKLTRKLLNELEQKHDELMKSVNHEENRSEKLRQDLELRNNNMSKVVRSNNAIQVFSTYKQDKIPEEMNALQITTKFEDYTGKVLQRICFSNGSTLVMKAYDVTPSRIALIPSGDLLISSMKSNLDILSQSTGTITESKYGVAPLQTVAVHITKFNRIIVGAREKGPPFPVNGPGKVIIMNMQGRIRKKYHLDSEGKPIFSQPPSITTDGDNNVYVLDLLSIDKWQGRIIALSYKMGLNSPMWTYDGHQIANKDQSFALFSLVTTPLNNFIVSDNNHMLHILNQMEECIHFLHTEEFDIHWPRSLDIDNSGTLYIGCIINNELDPWGAKILAVQFSGF